MWDSRWRPSWSPCDKRESRTELGREAALTSDKGLRDGHGTVLLEGPSPLRPMPPLAGGGPGPHCWVAVISMTPLTWATAPLCSHDDPLSACWPVSPGRWVLAPCPLSVPRGPSLCLPVPPWLSPSPRPLVPHIQPRGPPSCSLQHSPDARPVQTPRRLPVPPACPGPSAWPSGPPYRYSRVTLHPVPGGPSVHTHPVLCTSARRGQAAVSAGTLLLLSVVNPVQTSGPSPKPRGCLVREAALGPSLL